MIENFYNYVPSQIVDTINDLKRILEVVKNSKKTMSKVANFEKGKTLCPYCKENNVIKYGHTDTGIQNHFCKDCKKKFNDLTGTIFSGTHLTYEQIEIFLQCFIDKIPIRKTAKRMGVNKNTAHLLRLKIMDSFKSIRQNAKLSDEIESDEIYKVINLKGTKPKDMPRFSKHRTSNGTTTRDISKHKVCVATAIDENDNMFLEIVGTGPITSEMIKKSLVPKLADIKKLITDCKSSYESPAIENGWNLIQIKSKCYTDGNGNSLANINSVHSGLSSFFSNFRGVSTKHLQGYLDWYAFDKYLNYVFDEDKQNKELLKSTMNKSTDIITTNMYNNYSGIDFKQVYADYNYSYQP